MTDSAIANAMMQAWMQRGWLACLLWPCSVIFGGLIKLRLFLYRLGWLRQHKLAVPVIVVGNIFVGGTGKTPLTIWLLKQLQRAGYHPGVISRGYGGKADGPCIVLADSSAQQVGDEPVLIVQQSAVPVVVSKDRVAAGRTLLAHFPQVDVIVADDGLQHYALGRDVELVLFDVRGVGNGWLLPAGPLREPMTRGRDITVVNLTPGKALPASLPPDTVVMRLVGSSAKQLIHDEQTKLLAELDVNQKIVAAAGIGNPERFFTLLRKQGIRFSTLPLPDHFNYAENPFLRVTADLILITEKDAVKCRQSPVISADPRIWVVAVEAEIDDGVMDGVLRKLKSWRKT
jgi:tetraacyldisaccharide 4'-kinase